MSMVSLRWRRLILSSLQWTKLHGSKMESDWLNGSCGDICKNLVGGREGGTAMIGAVQPRRLSSRSWEEGGDFY